MNRTARILARGLLWAAVAAAALGAAADAQPVGPQLGAATEQFESGEWASAMAAFEALLDGGALSRAERSTARKYLGIGFVVLRQEVRAVDAFKALVAEDPDFSVADLALRGEARPDDAVARYFLQASFEWNQEQRQRRLQLLEQTSRRSALVRSMVIPGLGQRHLGYRGRSWAMAGLTVAAVSYAAVSDRAFRQARQDYAGATAGDFPALWDDYTRKADRADRALWLVGGVWALNLVDVALSGPNLGGLEARGLRAAVRPDGAALAWQLGF